MGRVAAFGTAAVAAGLVARGLVAETWPWLAFNLALAWVPIGLGWAATRSRGTLAALFVPWLLFLPNAPYLLTDLIHLRARAGVPLWFDAALLGGAGALGVAMGARSVADVAAAARRELGAPAGAAVTVLAPLASGFGMYLGRFERWNSWSLVTKPGALLRDSLAPLSTPGQHLEAWAFTAVFGGLFLVAAIGARPAARPAAALSRADG